MLYVPIHLNAYHTAHFPSHSLNLPFCFLSHTFYKDAEATQCVIKSQSARSGCNGDDCTTYWHVCIKLRVPLNVAVIYWVNLIIVGQHDMG